MESHYPGEWRSRTERAVVLGSGATVTVTEFELLGA